MQLGEFETYKGRPANLNFEVDTGWKDFVDFSVWCDDGLCTAEFKLKLPEVEKLVEQLSAWIGHHKV